jgi:hypothetical protein
MGNQEAVNSRHPKLPDRRSWVQIQGCPEPRPALGLGPKSSQGQLTNTTGPVTFWCQVLFPHLRNIGFVGHYVRIPNHTNVIKCHCTDYYSKGQGYGTEGTHPDIRMEPLFVPHRFHHSELVSALLYMPHSSRSM